MTITSARFEELLNTSEAASLLGIHTVTLRKWVREKRITPLRAGRNLRFRASELNQWLKGEGN